MESSPLKILYFIPKANRGGAQRYVYDLSTAAKERGHEVLVVTGADGELSERLRAAGVNTHAIERLGREVRVRAELEAFRELLRIIGDFAPDILHGNSSKAGLALFAGRLKRVPRLIFTAHGWAFNEERPEWQRALIWVFHYLTVLLSHATICVSEAVRRDARHMPGVARKLVVIRNGVREIEFLSRDEARQALAPALPSRYWIGTIAELHPTKQVPVLVKAFARLLPAHPDLGLVIVGEGQERARLERLIAVAGIEDRVVLAGTIPEASRYLKAFDIFALPSRSEALGYAVLEAGLAELPVVASRVGGIPEIVRQGVTGILVPSGDTAALMLMLEQLINDPELGQRLGKDLSAKVMSEFTIERMLDETFALYAN